MKSESTLSTGGTMLEALALGEPVIIALAIWATACAAHFVAASVCYRRGQNSPEWVGALAIFAYWPILLSVVCLGLAFKYLLRRPLVGLRKLFR
ncbi:hypothetical protein [Bradyrhizobium sp. USDA 3364]